MKSERRKFGKALTFAVLFALLAFVSVGCASAATIYVPDDYAKIQWAVDNASAGDTIIVRDGIYVENVNVNKRLTIHSENGSENCIIQAAESDDHIFELTKIGVCTRDIACESEEVGLKLVDSVASKNRKRRGYRKN